MEQLLIGDVVSVTAGRSPRRVAASMGDRLVTYSQLEAATQQLVRALSHRGVAVGHRVAWWGETSLDAIALWFALARLGAVCVPVNPRFTADEAGRLLDLADPALVVGDGAHAAQAELGALLAAPATTGISPPRIDENDPHVIFFTSGSSGKPKGVELSHRASRLRILGDASMWPSGPVVCMFPQFHMAGWYGPMTVWASADEVVYVERAEAGLRPVVPALLRHRHLLDHPRAPLGHGRGVPRHRHVHHLRVDRGWQRLPALAPGRSPQAWLGRTSGPGIRGSSIRRR